MYKYLLMLVFDLLPLFIDFFVILSSFRVSFIGYRLSYVEIYRYCFLNIHMWIPLSFYLLAFVPYCVRVCLCVGVFGVTVWVIPSRVWPRIGFLLLVIAISFGCRFRWLLSKNASICLELLLQLLLPMHDIHQLVINISLSRSRSLCGSYFVAKPNSASVFVWGSLLVSDCCCPLLKAALLASWRCSPGQCELHVKLRSIPLNPATISLFSFVFVIFFCLWILFNFKVQLHEC